MSLREFFQPLKRKKFYAGLAAAILLMPIIVLSCILLFSLPNFTFVGSALEIFRRILVALGVFCLISGAGSLLIGIPVYLVLEHKNVRSLKSYLLSSLFFPALFFTLISLISYFFDDKGSALLTIMLALSVPLYSVPTAIVFWNYAVREPKK